jgi:hypothetical protein
MARIRRVGGMEVLVRIKKLGRIGAVTGAALLLSSQMLAGTASADPVQPALVIDKVVDQGGLYDPSNSLYNAAWFTMRVYNGGTSTYTQMQLWVTPSDPTIVARAALDATADVPTPSNLCVPQGNGFYCTWPSNLGGGQYTDPLTFVFSAPGNPPPSSFDVAATLTTKDHTTSNGGGSGQDRDVTVTNIITVHAAARDDQQTPYTGPSSSPFSVSTWKQGNVGQRSTLTLAPSSTGYLTLLQEFNSGEEPALPPECVDAFDALSSDGYPHGQLIEADVNHGAPLSPYLEWKVELTYGKGVVPPPTSSVRLLHCTDLNRDGTYEVYQLGPGIDKKNNDYACPKDLSAVYTVGSNLYPSNGCVVSFSAKFSGPKSDPTKQNWTYTIIFRTIGNGFSKS